MNILLINHYAGSPEHGMEYRPYYMAREWVKRGHRVMIVAATYSHLRRKQPDPGVEHETIEGIHYFWLKTPPYQGNGIKRAINMFAFVTRLTIRKKRIARQFQPDVVIASSTYPLDIYPARSIAKLAGAGLVFEVHDLWPLTPIEVGGMSPLHPLMFALQRGENYAYRKSDKVVSLLPKAAEHMIRHGMAPHKFVYVPNGIVAEEWSVSEAVPEPHRQILQQLREEGTFLVAYTGSHGLINDLYNLVETAAMLKYMPVKLVFVGQGPEKENLMRRARELGVDDRTVFLPPVPKAAMPGLLAMMDALYVGFAPNPIFRFGISPNKLMDYLMAAKPIILAIDSGNDPVAESGAGISVPPGDPRSAAAAISQLMAMDGAERKRMGQLGRDYILINNEYSVLADQFLEVLAGVGKASGEPVRAAVEGVTEHV